MAHMNWKGIVLSALEIIEKIQDARNTMLLAMNGPASCARAIINKTVRFHVGPATSKDLGQSTGPQSSAGGGTDDVRQHDTVGEKRHCQARRQLRQQQEVGDVLDQMAVAGGEPQGRKLGRMDGRADGDQGTSRQEGSQGHQEQRQGPRRGRFAFFHNRAALLGGSKFQLGGAGAWPAATVAHRQDGDSNDSRGDEPLDGRLPVCSPPAGPHLLRAMAQERYQNEPVPVPVSDNKSRQKSSNEDSAD